MIFVGRFPVCIDGVKSDHLLSTVEFLVWAKQRHTNPIENEKNTVCDRWKWCAFRIEAEKEIDSLFSVMTANKIDWVSICLCVDSACFACYSIHRAVIYNLCWCIIINICVGATYCLITSPNTNDNVFSLHSKLIH